MFNARLTTLLSSLFLAYSSFSKAAEKPNILFIISDDQALNTIQALGSEHARTPNMDRLVREGTSFTRAYNMGSWSNAVCIPSRTMMMTGQLLWQAHETVTQKKPARLLMEEFKDAGYTTSATGKWHVVAGQSFKNTFDYVLDPRPGELPLAKKDRSEFTPWNKSYGGYWVGQKHVTDITGESATLLLKDALSRKVPFFLYTGFNAPHSTWQYEEKDLQPYNPETFELPPHIPPTHFFIQNFWPKKVTRDFVAQRYRQVAIMVERMDQQLGHILDELEKSDRAKNTYVVFLSDHGLSVGENGVMGKQNLYELSTKAPLIISGPGIAKNLKIDSPVYLQDVIPTLMDLVNIPIPERVKYKSLRPLLESKGQAPGPWTSVYGAFQKSMRSITKGPHKLVLYRRDQEVFTRLYQLENDPHEFNDLSENSELKPLIEDLVTELQNWEEQTGSSLNIRTHFSL